MYQSMPFPFPFPYYPEFARDAGFKSLPAAIVFAIIYASLLAWFARKSFIHRTYIYYLLTFFCTIRVAAFIIRAVLIGSRSAGRSFALFTADQALFELGYFPLLYSVYILVLDRWLLSKLPPFKHPLLRPTQNRKLFGIGVLIAVVLGIVAASVTGYLAKSILHNISTVIFLILTVIQAFQAVLLAESTFSDQNHPGKYSAGKRYGSDILLLISLLLLIREGYAIETVSKAINREHVWYPLVIVPEILAVILHVTPGLVPQIDDGPSLGLDETSPLLAS